MRSTLKRSAATARTARAIERQHARQAGHQRVERVEHAAGDAVLDHLAHRAAIERRDRRAAGHRLGEHEPERLARLHRIEQRARAAEQRRLGLVGHLADVDARCVPSTSGATFSR